MDFGEILAHDVKKFPNVRFGLPAAYDDIVMGTFIGLLGNPPAGAVQGILTTTLNQELANAPNAKAYYIDGITHVLTAFPDQVTATQGWHVDDWVRAMITRSSTWTNVVTPPR
ncbi:MAG: hypothetical protein U0169_07365 [Polyangiaceae bacterium]